ncbi:MAG TPA: hypothetical protein VHG71_06805 [Verrucomicrobiae bacterium]|nr:hypothetical protein [Verrucomicrobiae bacterium]
MKTISKHGNAGKVVMMKSASARRDAGLAAKKLEAAFDETHKRATEIGPVLEEILHIRHETKMW